MTTPRLHALPQPAPSPRPSLFAQIKDNALILTAGSVIVSMAVAFYFNDRTHLTDALEKVAAAVGQMQAGVN